MTEAITPETVTPARGASPTVKKLKPMSNGLLVLSVPAAVAAYFFSGVVAPIVPISIFIAAWTLTGWSMGLRFIARTPAARRTPINVALSGREVAVLPALLVLLSLVMGSAHPQMWTYTLLAVLPVAVYLGVVLAGIALKWNSRNAVIIDDDPVEVEETPAPS